MDHIDSVKPTDYNSPIKPTWCPGCGNFGILNGIRAALVEMELKPTDLLMVFDIGCNGNMADKINVYGFKGLHGRVLPTAAGAKVANNDLPVLALGGDGATLDEGMHHFIHTIRNNYDITFIMHNNCNFGLTTGQETPTTPKGQPMSATPWGAVGERLNPIQLALLCGVTFAANSWTGSIRHITDMIKAGMTHKGFSLINIYQDCPTYNKFENLDWLRQKVKNVEEIEGYDPQNRDFAFKVSDYGQDYRPVGVLYEDKESVPYIERLNYRSSYQTTLKDEVHVQDITPFLKEFE